MSKSQITTIDARATLDQMIQRGRFSHHPFITDVKFPIKDGWGTFENKVFSFDAQCDAAAIIAAMKENEFLPAQPIQGVAFSATPDFSGQVICLGASTTLNGKEQVVYVEQRYLGLTERDSVWTGSRWRFLGVSRIMTRIP